MATIPEIDASRLSERDGARLRQWQARAPQYFAIKALQQRLDCEGFMRGKGRWQRGALDWATHEALVEFERRQRVYGWGFLGPATREAIRRTPLESERESVLRVLTTEGVSTSAEWCREVLSGYARSAADLVRRYRADAAINGLLFDHDREESTVEAFGEALRMASTYPAEFLKRPELGRIAPQARADLVHIGDDLKAKAVWRAGVPLA